MAQVTLCGRDSCSVSFHVLTWEVVHKSERIIISLRTRLFCMPKLYNGIAILELINHISDKRLFPPSTYFFAFCYGGLQMKLLTCFSAGQSQTFLIVGRIKPLFNKKKKELHSLLLPGQCEHDAQDVEVKLKLLCFFLSELQLLKKLQGEREQTVFCSLFYLHAS